MTKRELINALEKFDDNIEIVTYDEEMAERCSVTMIELVDEVHFYDDNGLEVFANKVIELF